MDEDYDTTLDDVDPVFNDSEVSKWCISMFFLMHSVVDFTCQLVLLLLLFDIIQEHHLTEKEELVALNAFELISMLAGLNLESLFDSEQVHDVTDSSIIILNFEIAMCDSLNHHNFRRTLHDDMHLNFL